MYATDVYFKRPGLDFGNAIEGFARGMTMGDMISKRRRERKVREAFDQNSSVAPDGSVKYNRAGLVKQLAGLEPEMALKTDTLLKTNDRADRAYKLDAMARGLSEVENQQQYNALRKELETEYQFNTSQWPGVFSKDFKERQLSQAIPYLEKLKLEARGDGDFWKMMRLQMQKESLNLRKNRFGQQVKEWEDKEEDEKKMRNVPGYERTGEVMTTTQEAMKLRKAAAGAEQLATKLGRLRELVKKKGSFEYFGKSAAEMSSLATEIQLLAKNEDMYNLGVLAGPDLMLLEKITSSPDSLSSLFTMNKTRLQQIDTQLKSIQEKLASTMKASGYRKANEKASFPMQVRKDGKVATVKNEAELKEAQSEGWR